MNTNIRIKGKSQKYYIIKSKLRFVSFLIILFLAFFILVNIIMPKDTSLAYGQDISTNPYIISDINEYMIYEVQPGDTLWSIASKYGNSKNDVRKNIHLITSENGIDNEIKPGDIIKIAV